MDSREIICLPTMTIKNGNVEFITGQSPEALAVRRLFVSSRMAHSGLDEFCGSKFWVRTVNFFLLKISVAN